MKNINKEEISDFEKDWQKAFDQAEMPVENDIWSNIDAQLANKDAEKYKRKIVFYKWVAAASIVFAITLSYFSYNINMSGPSLVTTDDLTTPPIALKAIEENTLPSATLDGNDQKEVVADVLNDQSSLQKANGDNATTNNALAQISTKDSDATGPTENNVDIVTEERKVSQEPLMAKSIEEVSSTISGGTLINSSDKDEKQTASMDINAIADAQYTAPAEAKILDYSAFEDNTEVANTTFLDTKIGKPYDLQYHAQLLDPPYIYAIPGIGMERAHKNNNERKILWAGLNIGSGMFDPNFENGSNYQPKTSPALSQTYAQGRESMPQDASFKENTNAGITYSLGVNFGIRLTPKWVVQSGIQYAHKSASTSSTTYLRNNVDTKTKPTYLGQESNAMTNNSASTATFAQEYDLLNSFEFASIPLKAGYLLIDRKVGLMLTAGIGADIFLSNTISESNNKLDEVKMEAGNDSPFRDVNFNGLLGAEIFYQISRQYHLTLEPNYSMALNPFTKAGETFKSSPQTFGITAGLKYYWK